MSTTPTLRDAAQAAYELLSSGLGIPDAKYRVVTELAAALTQGAGEAVEPVAYLWRNVIDGLPRVVMPDSIITADASWVVEDSLHTAQQLQQAVARALEPIQQAIRDYHYALDTRQHGGVAQGKAVGAIEEALGMPWKRGEELAARTPKDAGA